MPLKLDRRKLALWRTGPLSARFEETAAVELAVDSLTFPTAAGKLGK